MKQFQPDSESRVRQTRRQFLRWIPAVAGAMAAGQPLAGSARTILPEDDVPIRLPAAAAPTLGSAVDMPFRTKEEAIRACTLRRYWEERRGARSPYPLERVLGDNSLVESRLGLVNWPLVDETEDLNLGHFVFPISPFNVVADDGAQQFLHLSNTQVIANFRNREYLEQVHRRIFDRAVWAMDNGRHGTAIVEYDRPVADQKVERTVRLLHHYGVRTIIWGNEPNDPYTPWRDDLSSLFDMFSAAASTRNAYRLNDLELSLPGLAYFGHGEYLEKMLRAFKELQARRNPRDRAPFPVQRVADHYYGSVEAFLARIRMMRDIMSREGAGDLKYDVTEVGNPTLGGGQQKATDEQLATGFVPQISALAVGSGLVERVAFYALLDSSPDFSVMLEGNGHLSRRATYSSFLVMARLLARLVSTRLTEEAEIVRVQGSRSDGIGFQVVWSKVPDRDTWIDLPRGQRVFDAFGNELKEERPGQISLKPKSHPALAGPARIFISGR